MGEKVPLREWCLSDGEGWAGARLERGWLLGGSKTTHSTSEDGEGGIVTENRRKDMRFHQAWISVAKLGSRQP